MYDVEVKFMDGPNVLFVNLHDHSEFQLDYEVRIEEDGRTAVHYKRRGEGAWVPGDLSNLDIQSQSAVANALRSLTTRSGWAEAAFRRFRDGGEP